MIVEGVVVGDFQDISTQLRGFFLQDYLDGFIFFTPLQMVGFVVFCTVLGLTGSYSAMRKYLTIEGVL